MDLSGIQKLRFKNIKDGSTIDIPPLGGILGRNGDINPSYFKNLSYISRKHAKIYYDRGRYFIEDLGSKNGTKVNGLKIDSYLGIPIRGGDNVSIADMEFKITYL